MSDTSEAPSLGNYKTLLCSLLQSIKSVHLTMRDVNTKIIIITRSLAIFQHKKKKYLRFKIKRFNSAKKKNNYLIDNYCYQS